MRNHFVILFLFMATPVSAENWVCYDLGTKEINKSFQGDCLALGLCSGKNNTGLQLNCFEANKEEFDKAKQGNVKFDGSIVSGIRVVDLTAEEITAKEKPRLDAEALRKSKIDALKLKLKGMGLIDEEVGILLNSGSTD